MSTWQQIQNAPPPAPGPLQPPPLPLAPQTPQQWGGGTPTWQQLQTGNVQNNQAQPPLITADPRDQPYYDQQARVIQGYKTINAAIARAQTQDQAAYTSGTSALTTQLPLTLANTRNQANSQGLLESGILGQRAGANQAAYAGKMGALLSRFQGQQGNLSDQQQNADANYNNGLNTAYTRAVGRATKADVANGVDMAAIPIPKTTANSFKPPPLYGSVKSAAAARAQSRGVPASHAQPATPAGATGRNASRGVKATASRIY